MTNENQPLDRRQQQIAGLRELVDFLAAHPDLPIGNDSIGRECITAGDDTAGRAELQAIADILGTEVQLSRGGGSYEVSRQFGTVTYRAFYCTREAMRQHGEELKVVAEYRKNAAVES